MMETELEQRKRELGRQIGCLRRRIDSRIRSIEREARRAVSWRTHLRRFPGQAIVGALGAGLALSAGLKSRSVSRWLGMRLVRRASVQAGRQLWQEVKQLWAQSAPGAETQPGEAEA